MLAPAKIFLALLLWASWLTLGNLLAPLAAAQSLVLDEEFNQFSHRLSQPLRASLVPNRAVHFVLVNDPAINAFVTNENLVYLHSGLVLKAKNAAELQGVLAHELGHLAAGHLNNRDLMQRQGLLPALAGAVLGAGAAVAGAPQVAMAAVLGGQAWGMQNVLGFSRMQESEADQHAVQALHKANLSAAGMTGLFNTLRTQSQLSYDSPPPWLVTHPLPAERLARLGAIVQEESPAQQSGLAKQEEAFDWPRLQAKVAALTQTPASVLRQFQGSSAPARYARALAFMRQGKLAEAAPLLAALREESPSDPFYTEAAAQLATMQNDLPKATQLFQAALQRQPNGLLLRYQLAEVLRAQGNAKAASDHYRAITRAWPIWSEPWEGLGRTLGQQGQLANSHLAFAEAAVADGDVPAATQSLALARTYLKQTPSPESEAWANSLEERLKP